MAKYAKSNNGVVHLISAINSEYTLCGDAFDAGSGAGEDFSFDWAVLSRGAVTCPLCQKEILNCRNAQIKLKITN